MDVWALLHPSPMDWVSVVLILLLLAAVLAMSISHAGSVLDQVDSHLGQDAPDPDGEAEVEAEQEGRRAQPPGRPRSLVRL